MGELVDNVWKWSAGLDGNDHAEAQRTRFIDFPFPAAIAELYTKCKELALATQSQLF
jgi:hypothetical protein